MIATTNPLTAARAAALFVSDLSAYEQPTRVLVEAAIKQALQAHYGARGCAAGVAATYGDHPELAVPRMRWAISLVESLYQRRTPRRPLRATTLAGRHPARPQQILAHVA